MSLPDISPFFKNYVTTAPFFIVWLLSSVWRFCHSYLPVNLGRRSLVARISWPRTGIRLVYSHCFITCMVLWTTAFTCIGRKAVSAHLDWSLAVRGCVLHTTTCSVPNKNAWGVAYSSAEIECIFYEASHHADSRGHFCICNIHF